MLVEERGLKEGLAGPSFSLLNLRQSYFSCKQAKLLPEIKECSGERRVSQNLEWEGTLMYLMIDKGAVLLFFFFFLVYFYIPWHFSCLYVDFLCYGMCLSKIAISCLLLSHVSHVRLLATPWTVAYQAPLSIGFPRQEYWSGLPLPSPIPCLAYSFVHITPVWKNKLISSPFEVDSVQFICSVVSDSLWPWTAASQASLSITNSQSLLKLMSIELLMPSHLILLFPSPPAFNLSQHQGFSNESVLRISWPTYWSFSFSISPSNEYSGLISFRIDWFDLLAVWGTLKSLLQHHSSKASILQCSAFLILSHPYMSTGKTIASTKMDLCCLCFLISCLGWS